MRKSVLLALLLTAGPSSAGHLATHQLLGWTADGIYFAYVAAPEDCGEPNDFSASGSVTFGVVVDGRTGLVAERYFLKLEGEAKPDERKQFKAMPGKKQFEAWKAAHPVSCGSEITSPDGKAKADVQVKGKGVKGKWRKNEFEFHFEGDDMAEEKKATFALGVVRDGKTVVPSATWSGSAPMAGAGAGFTGAIGVCWAPNARRVMWSLERNPGMMRDTGEHSLVVGSTGGPRIQLVADPSVLAQAAAAVGAALDQAGFTPTSAKASNEKTARAATVVYAATGFEDAAKQVAAAVPGGATVAALDWKAPFDVVVGIGQTALK